MLKQKTILISIIILFSSAYVSAAGWMDDLGLPPDVGNANPISSYLNITSVTANVDNKKETLAHSGAEIGGDAEPNSNIELKVEVKNLFADKKIDNLEIEAIIEDIGDGDDLDDASGSFSLDAGESDDKTIRFKLPLKVDDGSYGIKIHAEGKDKGGKKQEADWETSLTVKKDKHKVKITKADIEPSTVSCSEQSNLELGIINLGREDEEVNIGIKNDALGINLNEEGIQLNEGIDDSEYENKFVLNIPNNIAEGNYPIRIDVSYGSGRYTAAKEAVISVQDCIISKEAKTEQKVLIRKNEKASAASPKTTAEAKIKALPQAAVPKAEFNESKSYLALLAFSLFIVTIGIVILLGVLMRGLKK